MKIIWNGTDSLYLVKYPKQVPFYKYLFIFFLRILTRILDVIVQEHYACGEIVEHNLKTFGIKKPILRYQTPISIDKIEHVDGPYFNILYYYPMSHDSKLREWIYGVDVYSKLYDHFMYSGRMIDFVVVQGNNDMNEEYKHIDLLIRPNRHDGDPRMVRECQFLGIPVIHTKENPDVNKFIQEIEYYYEQWRKRHEHTEET